MKYVSRQSILTATTSGVNVEGYVFSLLREKRDCLMEVRGSRSEVLGNFPSIHETIKIPGLIMDEKN